MGFANNSYLINKLEVCNFRKFESISVSFERQLTVLVGDNGVGKSTGFCIFRRCSLYEQTAHVLPDCTKCAANGRISIPLYKNLYFCDCA